LSGPSKTTNVYPIKKQGLLAGYHQKNFDLQSSLSELKEFRFRGVLSAQSEIPASDFFAYFIKSKEQYVFVGFGVALASNCDGIKTDNQTIDISLHRIFNLVYTYSNRII
jgi:hypothetical protein